MHPLDAAQGAEYSSGPLVRAFRAVAGGAWPSFVTLITVLARLVLTRCRWMVAGGGGDARDAEILALRHQVLVLQRQINRAQVTETDRTVLALLASLMDRARRDRTLMIVRPATVIGWHRRLVARRLPPMGLGLETARSGAIRWDQGPCDVGESDRIPSSDAGVGGGPTPGRSSRFGGSVGGSKVPDNGRGYPQGMARTALDFELDPAVVPIPDDTTLSIDEWLDMLPREEEEIELTVPSPDLVAEARRESE